MSVNQIQCDLFFQMWCQKAVKAFVWITYYGRILKVGFSCRILSPSLYREGNWGRPRWRDLPKAPKEFDSGPRSEHGPEIHAETESGNTHFFSLCQKFSCFHKHYTPMMRFSNSRLKKHICFTRGMLEYQIICTQSQTPGWKIKSQNNTCKEQLHPSLASSFYPPSQPWC